MSPKRTEPDAKERTPTVKMPKRGKVVLTASLVRRVHALKKRGNSLESIVEILASEGTRVSKGTVHTAATMPDPGGEDAAVAPAAPRGSARSGADGPEVHDGPPDASESIVGGDDDGELTPDELRVVLSRELRRAQAAAARAEAEDEPGEAKAQRKLVAVFAAQLRQIHNKADEDTETVRVSADEMRAAGARAWEGLEMTARSVLAEVAGWGRCASCGQPHGRFAGVGGSAVRMLFERLAMRGA